MNSQKPGPRAPAACAAVFFAALLASTLISNAWAADAAKGKAIFDSKCASCHGPVGAGDGPVAINLPPEMKPRNLQEAKFKVATDDAKMKEVIQKGGAVMGLNPLMPPQPGLSDAEIGDLIAYVHSLKK